MDKSVQHGIASSSEASNRSFGVVFAAVFAIVAGYPLIDGGAVRLWAVALSTSFILAALLRPTVLELPNRLWTKLGILLHKIMSPIALAVVFYCTVVPTGLLLRLLRKDPLCLKFDAGLDSYWITRTPPGPSPESLENQF